MYILESVIHKTIWGGDRLSYCTKNRTGGIGHLYIFNGHKDMTNAVVNYPTGITLRELFQKEKAAWNMEDYDEFPLTIALVDATDDLSIQVHPDDCVAEKIEGSRIGKCESWYFLQAPQTGWIYAGCNYDSKDKVEKAALSGQIESIAGHLPIKEGDYVCIHAGTLHSMTAGCLTFEIEYGSDFTYRFYDFDRVDEHGMSRDLHIDKALQSINTLEKPQSKVAFENTWISEQNYEIKILTQGGKYRNFSEEIELVSMIDGLGTACGVNISSGMGIILLPGESLDDIEYKKMVVARLRR